MNYRHHFHAGNFADVMKHAVLIALIDAMRAQGPVRLIETHAGAGLYDLEGEVARRTGEAEAGAGRLMTAAHLPGSLAGLKRIVQAENPTGDLRLYPGSPLVALAALGAGDAYVGCELRPDDAAALQTLLASRGRGASAQALATDGYAALEARLGQASKGRGDLVLIDPPYERGDDYDRAAEAVAVCRARGAAVALWAPIKDLETLDALVRRIEVLAPRRLIVAEVRLRPLINPMKMNGSTMLLVDTPNIVAEVEAICRWTAVHCGEAGARGVVSADF